MSCEVKVEKMSFNLIQIPLHQGETKLVNDWLSDPPPLLVFSLTEENPKGIVGRHSTSDFRIRSEIHPVFVSRKHARIIMRNGKLYVEDLSSANGTFVNYQKLEALCETPLKAGDCVAFGCKTKTAPYSPDDMPIRFKVHQVKETTHRPVLKKHKIKVIERQSKKIDERDSGVDDVDSQPRVKTRRSMPNVDKSGALPGTPSSSSLKRSSMSTIDILKTGSKKKSGKSDPVQDEVDFVQTEDCSSTECVYRSKEPEDDSIPWVQCDSCDRWFHTACVGCDYNKVSLAAHQFHCGMC